MKGLRIVLAVTVFGSLVPLLVYELTITSPILTPSPCTDNATFLHALARRATPDRYVILALVDAAFVDMAVNLYETSLRPNGIDNFLFVGVGRQACELMANGSLLPNPLPCYHFVNDVAADKASVYLSSDFIRKMNIRTDMIIEALNAGFTVVHIDLDVFFFRNPLPHLKTVMLNADIATMWDQSAYNAGFVVVRPTWYGRRVYELIRRKTKASKKLDDQTALNHVIAHMKRSYKENEFTAVVLNVRRYLCGVNYFESTVDRWFTDRQRLQLSCRDDAASCPIVVHNNWIVSREAKIFRFKEHLMWMYDKDGYFSSPTTNYIIYENLVGIWNTRTERVDAQLNGLRTALTIANILDRVLILPRFHCYRKLAGILAECPLNSLLRITAFDAGFAGRYRESSFLSNPLVPVAVSGSVSPRYFIGASKIPVSDNNTSTSIVVRGSSEDFISDDELRQLVGSDQHRVVSLASLDHIHVKFKSAAQQQNFDDTITASFKRSDYRQMAHPGAPEPSSANPQTKPTDLGCESAERFAATIRRHHRHLLLLLSP